MQQHTSTCDDLIKEARDHLSEVKKACITPMKNGDFCSLKWDTFEYEKVLSGLLHRLREQENTAIGSRSEGKGNVVLEVIKGSEALKNELDDEINQRIAEEIRATGDGCVKRMGMSWLDGNTVKSHFHDEQISDFRKTIEKFERMYGNIEKPQNSRDEMVFVLGKLREMHGKLGPGPSSTTARHITG
ncbi:hypothetical protein BD410DRAFT_806550 [Rickenella mellea]|uniref:Uncharacterized protein n=1 Tax=Rickenella mellea TaxID=50990 RepID=A0A4Y7PT93_9AGAM|nr:hypothetical protein BD410DRAFT_806550 [Rickenella mellea]